VNRLDRSTTPVRPASLGGARPEQSTTRHGGRQRRSRRWASGRRQGRAGMRPAEAGSPRARGCGVRARPRAWGDERAAAHSGEARFRRRWRTTSKEKESGRWSKVRGSSLRPSIRLRKGGGWTSTSGTEVRARVNGSRRRRTRFRPREGAIELAVGR